MRIGRMLGERYRLDEEIATGGMGSVWRGTDLHGRRTVAIKVLHPRLAADRVFRLRFETEAAAMGSLQASGIVDMYDSGTDRDDEGELCFLVMEHVAGRTLQDILMTEQTIPPRQVARIAAETAEALHVAHSAGIIHRDVKPANILITDDDGAVRIVDFGIARAHGGAGLTSTGMVMGTAAYVSPEQLRGHDPTGASDVYALGVVAYECLTGVHPFGQSDSAAIINGEAERPPRPLPDHIDADIAAVVLRALERDPANRWPDARQFALACRSAAGLKPARRRPGSATRVAATHAAPYRRRTMIAAGLAGLILVALVVAALTWSGGDTEVLRSPTGGSMVDVPGR